VTAPFARRAAALALAWALAACSGAGPVGSVVGPGFGEGRLVLYLNGSATAPLDLIFQIRSIEAVREDGGRLALRSAPVEIGALRMVDRQVLLAEVALPQGRYRQVALGVGKARARQEGRWVDLAAPPEGVALDTAFEVRAGEATPLFMTWDVGRSIEGETTFRPAFRIEGKAHELRGVLAYVTNEGSDTVSVIDRSVDRVVSVLAVGRAPRGVAVTADTARAVVVNSGSHTLSIIDVNSDRVIHTTNLEAASGASEVVVAPDGRTLYVSNTLLNTVSAISALSFRTLRSIAVGLRPSALALVPSGAMLLVANTGSNTLSVIDAARNEVAATIAVDFRPAYLAVDPTGAQAFVPHLGSPRLSVVSLAGLRVTKTVTAGVAAAVLPESGTATDRVFVARPREGRVSLYDVALNAELAAIAVGHEPRHLALDADRDKIYVVNRGSDTVTVLDRISRRVRATIEVGRRPWAMAIVP
jgi:YVTN family beta-propeller protein